MTEVPVNNQGRKIVLLARNSESAAMLYNYVSRYYHFHAIIVEDPIPASTMFWKRVKRIGFFTSLSQVMFILLVSPCLSLVSKKRKKAILSGYRLDMSPIPADKIKKVPSVNTEDCRSLLQALEPDLVIVNGTRIIAEKTIRSVTAPFINIHDGITPAFRGVHGGYWAIANGRPDLFGTTIHYVDKGIDTGKIIDQVFIQPSRNDNFSTYPILQHAIIMESLVSVIDTFISTGKIPEKQPVCENMPLRFHPTLFQWMGNLGRTLFLCYFVKMLIYHL